MTMKPNTELNTMMFFDDALEGERTQLLPSWPMPSARPARRRIRLRS